MNRDEIQLHLDNCHKGNHKLRAIYSETHHGCQMGVVVRWCEVCGSVVVDGEHDGRTSPGRYMNMKGPGLYMEFKNNE